MAVTIWRGKGRLSFLGVEMMQPSLVDKIKADFPNFRFIKGSRDMFRPPKTIVVGPPEPHGDLLLLHELGHAVYGVYSYNTDIDRLKIELGAWEEARKLAKQYGVDFDEEFMQEQLDTYRDWLHQKSRCPKCGLTRFQSPDGQYHCPLCENY